MAAGPGPPRGRHRPGRWESDRRRPRSGFGRAEVPSESRGVTAPGDRPQGRVSWQSDCVTPGMDWRTGIVLLALALPPDRLDARQPPAFRSIGVIGAAFLLG